MKTTVLTPVRRRAAVLAAMLVCTAMPLLSQVDDRLLSSKYKTFSVIGDSYSTFVGKTEPVDNAQFYPREGIDIYEASQTWWKLFERETGIRLEQNNSFSGGTICNTWWNGDDASTVSFVYRCQNLRGADLIVVEGGTNDSNANSPIGEYKYADWTAADLKSFRPATAWVLNYLKQKFPDALVVFMLNNGLKADINASVVEICRHYDVPLLKLSGVSKAIDHPTYAGMQTIRDQLMALLAEREGYTVLNGSANNTFKTDVEGADVCLRMPFRAGEWTTLCLPFSLSGEQLAAVFGPGAVVARMEDTEGDVLKFSTVETTEAHMPYIVCPTISRKGMFSVEGVAIKAGTAQSVTCGACTMAGFYRPRVFNAATPGVRILNPQGHVEELTQSATLQAFNAYFRTTDTTSRYTIVVDGGR